MTADLATPLRSSSTGRSLRRTLLSTGSAALVAAASLVGAGAVTAASPLDVTVNVDLFPTTTTMSTAAKPTYVGYQVVFSNTNGSTLTQVRLTIDAPTTPSGVAGVYHGTFPNGDGSCAQITTGGVSCAIGQMAPGAGFNRTFVFRTPLFTTALVGEPLRFTSAGTSLFVKEGGSDNGARNDTFHPVALSSNLEDTPVGAGGDEVDFFSTYTLPSGGTWSTNTSDIQQDTKQLSAANPQGTKITVPSTARGTETVIQEIGDSRCPTQACFGETTEVTVPGLQPTDVMTVFIRWDSSAVPGGVTQKNLKVAWDATETGAWVTVTTICNASASNTPCRYAAVRFKDKDLGVMLKLPHNGVIRGL